MLNACFDQTCAYSLLLKLRMHGERSQYIALEFVGVDARYRTEGNVTNNYVIGFCNKGKCFGNRLLCKQIDGKGSHSLALFFGES